MAVTWLPRFIDEPPVASDAAVAAVEAALGVRLPADYLAVARVHQGAMPSPYLLNEAGVATALTALYHFEAEPASYSLVNVHADVAGRLPAKTIAFAKGSGGDQLCFDYRKSDDAPRVTVLLHDHPGAPYRELAASFTDLIGKLVDAD